MPEAGFTLLEVLVALVVFGFIVGGLSAGTLLGLKASELQAGAEAAHRDLQPVDEALRRLVAGIATPSDPHLPGLAGQSSGFICITQDPAPGYDGPPTRVDASVTMDTSRQLVLRWSVHVHAKPLLPRPAPREDVLLQGLERLEIGYLSPDRSGWLAGWSRDDLPPLIRIRLVFPPGDPRHWPPIITAPRHDRAPEE